MGQNNSLTALRYSPAISSALSEKTWQELRLPNEMYSVIQIYVSQYLLNILFKTQVTIHFHKSTNNVEASTPLITNSTTGYETQPVPAISDPHNLSP